MPLPEIPDSWFKFLTSVAAFIAAVAASIGVFFSKDNGAGIKVLHDNQQVNAQKLDSTAAKVDAAATKVDAAKEVTSAELKLVGSKTDRIADTLKK